MRPYVAILSGRFRTLLQYRAAAAAGFATQLFWGLIRMMIFTAFYESTVAPQPMRLADVIAYVWLGQAFLVLFPFRADPELAQLICTGNVAYELLRPVDLYGLWYSREIANRSAPALLRAVPMLVIATLVGWIHWPGPAPLAAFAVMLALAVLLSSAVAMLMTLTLFWTLSGRGINTMVTASLFLLSGMIVPLPLFPPGLRTLLDFLPFRGLCDVPFRLFTGDMPLDAFPQVAIRQAAWVVVLVVLGRCLMSRARHRLVVQGG